MENLPTEILFEIFGYLSPNVVLRCALVCKRWKSIARTPKFFGTLIINGNWTKMIKVFNDADAFPFRKLAIVRADQECMDQVYGLQQGNIRQLEVFLTPEVVEKQFEWISRFTRVEHLSIYNGSQARDFTKFHQMESMKTLKANSLNVIEALIPKFPKLQKVVYVCLSYPLDWRKFHKIAALVPMLCVAFKFVIPAQLDVLNQATTKSNIEFHEIKVRVRRFGLTMDSVLSACQAFNNLQKLLLVVDKCLTPSTFVEIANCIPNLRELTVERIEEWPVEYVLDDMSPCQKLHTLTLSFQLLTGYVCLLKFVKKAKTFHNLKKLSVLEGTRRRCIVMEDSEFELAMMSCSKLLHLELGCELTDFQLQAVTQHVKGLQKLDLLKKVSDAQLILIKDLMHLERLQLESSAGLTYAGLINGLKLMGITHLGIRKCKNIAGSQTIRTIAKKYPFIKLRTKW